MSIERKLHKIASLFGLVKGRRLVRAQAHRHLARVMRKMKLGRP